MQKWRARCAYDGGAFSGWQSQPSGDAVQDVIEARLGAISGRPIRIHGAGRTDAGVHATGQVFHFELDWKHTPEALLLALRSTLPKTLLIRDLARSPKKFHARNDAVGKRYGYYLLETAPLPFLAPQVWDLPRRDSLDLEAMREAANGFLGTHDFSPFAALARSAPAEIDPVKTVWECSIRRRVGGVIAIRVEGSGFLYRMVRSMVGALVEVGRGKEPPSFIAERLAAGQRVATVVTAPARGLFLEKVYYRRPARAGVLKPVQIRKP